MDNPAVMDLACAVTQGEMRAVAKAISLVENCDPAARGLIDLLYPRTGGSSVIGVTGSPGAGKSTLVDRLIALKRQEGHSVAVIAVDASSPFSGGALLGDRLRMQGHGDDAAVFIRSVASRGFLGGLTANTSDAVRILEAAGYENIFVETVGVGQSETNVMEISDIVLLVLMPGTGDDIQALKAGIMEIADILIVNKGDLAGADRLRSDVTYALSLMSPHNGRPANPIVETSALYDKGIIELGETIHRYRTQLENSGGLERRRRNRIRCEVESEVRRRVGELLEARVDFSQHIAGWVDTLYRREARPYALIDEEIRGLFKEAAL